MGIRVEDGGMFTTVQDEGRFGYQQFGMTTAGPMEMCIRDRSLYW